MNIYIYIYKGYFNDINDLEANGVDINIYI